MDAEIVIRRLNAGILCLFIATACIAADLTAPCVTLPEVLITGTKIGAARSFTGEEIRASGARTVAEFLEQVTGIALRLDGASGGKAFARIGGSNANQVLVLIDGVRLSDVGSGETDLSKLSAEWIESIEVTQGGGSVGGEAIGGVIAVKTNQTAHNELRVYAHGSSSLTTVGARQEFARDELTAAISVTREQGRGDYAFRVIEADGNGPFTLQLGQTLRRENNELLRDHAMGKVTRKLGRHELGGMMLIERAVFGLPGYLAPRPTPLAEQNELFNLAQVSWQTAPAVGMIAVALASQHQTRDFFDPDLYSYLHESHEYSTRQTAIGSWSKQTLVGSLSASARLERERLASGVLENSEAVRNRWQSAVQWSRSIALDRLERHEINVSAVGQIERFGDAKMQWLPSAEASYTWEATLPVVIGVRGSQAYLAPSFYSLFWNDELLAQGNPDLRPETSTVWTGYARARTRNAHSTNVDINGTLNRVTDLIFWRQAFDGRWTPQNLRSATLNQLTLSVKQVMLPKHADVGVSFEWLEARDRSGERTTNDKYLIYRPARTARADIRIRGHSTQGGVTFRWVDKQAVLETNSKWLPRYSILDAELSHTFRLGAARFSASLACENVLNTDYRVVRHAPMPLRQWWLTLSIAMGK
ncbi:MAG: TonB-dependent receptor [bacterium]|nr:TonB-dependent receptor [bacterium]